MLLQQFIYDNQDEDLYWSDDWSAEFYIECAYAGFISVSQDGYILPEMQKEYAVLDWKNLHVSGKVKPLLSGLYDLRIDTSFKRVLDAIENHHSPNSWMGAQYRKLLENLFSLDDLKYGFTPHSIELYRDDVLAAGEIGYTIGSTYTSLTGFSLREKHYNNAGKVQLVMLAQYLEKSGFDFWNMGHTAMQYKMDLGAAVFQRKNFLERWMSSRRTERKQL